MYFLQNRTILLLVFISQIFVTRSQGPRDGCSLRIRKRYNRVAYVKTDQSCTSGKIWWSYPAGKVVVDFQHDQGLKPFLLCLNLKPDPANINFFDISEREYKPVELPLSKPGHYTCIPDFHGAVSVLMDAPFFPLTYLYSLEYRLLIDWVPVKRLSKVF